MSDQAAQGLPPHTSGRLEALLDQDVDDVVGQRGGRRAAHEGLDETTIQRVLEGGDLRPHRADGRVVAEVGGAADEDEGWDTRSGRVLATSWATSPPLEEATRTADPRPSMFHEGHDVGGEVLGAVAVLRRVGVAMAALGGRPPVQGRGQVLEDRLEVAPGLDVRVHEHHRRALWELPGLGVGHPSAPFARTTLPVSTTPMSLALSRTDRRDR